MGCGASTEKETAGEAPVAAPLAPLSAPTQAHSAPEAPSPHTEQVAAAPTPLAVAAPTALTAPKAAAAPAETSPALSASAPATPSAAAATAAPVSVAAASPAAAVVPLSGADAGLAARAAAVFAVVDEDKSGHFNVTELRAFIKNAGLSEDAAGDLGDTYFSQFDGGSEDQNAEVTLAEFQAWFVTFRGQYGDKAAEKTMVWFEKLVAKLMANAELGGSLKKGVAESQHVGGGVYMTAKAHR